MDRSFLSQPAVIVASRKFVCIRLTSYEDETEMKFCRSLFIGRSGDAENTTFTILSPDGRDPLVRTHRGAKQIYANAAAMAEGMNQIAARYSNHADGTPSLPITLDARMGLDVAASDNLPLVLVVADAEHRAELETKISALAWHTDFIGRFTYAIASSPKDVPAVTGLTIKNGVVLIEPDTFGQKGRIVKQLDEGASNESITAAMLATLSEHKKIVKNMQQHRAAGVKEGAFWEPKLPVTDREEAAARERTKKQIENQKKAKSSPSSP